MRKIRAAKAELEAEAREKAEEKKAAEAKLAELREQEARTGKKTGGREPQVPDPEKAMPEAKAQRNFTDPDSRIMPEGSHKGSFVQGYNAQVAVDGEAQVIVAAEVTQEPNDKHQLAAMLEQVKQNVGGKPQAASADTGYWDAKQVSNPRVQGIDLHVAVGKQKHGERNATAKEDPDAVESGKPDSLLKLFRSGRVFQGT